MNKNIIIGSGLAAVLLLGGGIFVLTRSSSDSNSKASTVAKAPGTAEEQVKEPAKIIAESAKYKIDLQATWSKQTHPDTIPDGAHVSPLVVAAHSTAGDVVGLGKVSSPGFKKLAETGATPDFIAELTANSGVLTTARGTREDVPATVSVELAFTKDASLLSAVTMLAPSPDWVVGIADLDLLESGDWLDSKIIKLNAFDAGTDSGQFYKSKNSITSPVGVVHIPTEGQFAEITASTGYGVLVITKIP